MFSFINNYKKILNYFLVFTGTLYLIYVVIIIYPEDNYPSEFLNELSYNLQFYFKEESKNRIIKLLQSTALNGSNEGQYYLAKMYATGCFEALDRRICDKYEMVPDKEKAIKWYRISAENGNQLAQKEMFFYYNTGTHKNSTEALKWTRMSANQGNPDAQNSLANMYLYGNNVEKNYEKAFKLFKLSALHGYKYAINNLATMYLEGKGTEINYKKALDLYTSAAEQGLVGAQNALSRYFPKLNKQ